MYANFGAKKKQGVALRVKATCNKWQPVIFIFKTNEAEYHPKLPLNAAN